MGDPTRNEHAERAFTTDGERLDLAEAGRGRSDVGERDEHLAVGDIHQLFPVLGMHPAQRAAPGPRVVHLDELESLANRGFEVRESKRLAEEAPLVAERLQLLHPDTGEPTRSYAQLSVRRHARRPPGGY